MRRPELWTRLAGPDDCGSWYVRHAPWSPHPPQCQAPRCTEHPVESIIWSANPRRDLSVVLRTAAGEWPADADMAWVCKPHSEVIGVSAAEAGVGGRVLVGGIHADVQRWPQHVQPVDPQTLMDWLAAVPDHIVRPGRPLREVL